jgi:hypothetical protein
VRRLFVIREPTSVNHRILNRDETQWPELRRRLVAEQPSERTQRATEILLLARWLFGDRIDLVGNDARLHELQCELGNEQVRQLLFFSSAGNTPSVTDNLSKIRL